MVSRLTPVSRPSQLDLPPPLTFRRSREVVHGSSRLGPSRCTSCASERAPVVLVGHEGCPLSFATAGLAAAVVLTPNVPCEPTILGRPKQLWSALAEQEEQLPPVTAPTEVPGLPVEQRRSAPTKSSLAEELLLLVVSRIRPRAPLDRVAQVCSPEATALQAAFRALRSAQQAEEVLVLA